MNSEAINRRDAIFEKYRSHYLHGNVDMAKVCQDLSKDPDLETDEKEWIMLLIDKIRQRFGDITCIENIICDPFTLLTDADVFQTDYGEKIGRAMHEIHGSALLTIDRSITALITAKDREMVSQCDAEICEEYKSYVSDETLFFYFIDYFSRFR